MRKKQKAPVLFTALFMESAVFLCAATLTCVSVFAWPIALAAMAAAGLTAYTAAGKAVTAIRQYLKEQSGQQEQILQAISGFADNSLRFFTSSSESLTEQIRLLSKDWTDALDSLEAAQSGYLAELAASQRESISELSETQSMYIAELAAAHNKSITGLEEAQNKYAAEFIKSQSKYIKSLASLQNEAIQDLKNQQYSMENNRKEQQAVIADVFKTQSAAHMNNLQDQISQLIAQLGRQEMLTAQNMENRIAELGTTIKLTNTEAVNRLIQIQKDENCHLADVCDSKIQHLIKSCEALQEHQQYASRLIDRMVVENKQAASGQSDQLAKLSEQERIFITETSRQYAELSAVLQSGADAYRSMAGELSVSLQEACRQYLMEFAKKSNADMQNHHKQIATEFVSLAKRLNTAMNQTASDCTSGISQAVHDCTAEIGQTVGGYTFRMHQMFDRYAAKMDQMINGYTTKIDQTISGYTAKMDQTVGGYTTKIDQTMHAYTSGISQAVSGCTEKLDSNMERYTQELIGQSAAMIGEIGKADDKKLEEVCGSIAQLAGQEEAFIVQYRENMYALKQQVETLICCQNESFEQIRIRDGQNISSLQDTLHQNQKEWYDKYEELSSQAVRQYEQSMETYRDQFVAASAAALAEVEKDNVDTIADAYKNITVIYGMVDQMREISLEHEKKLQEVCAVIAMGMNNSTKKQAEQFADFNEDFSDNVSDLSDTVYKMSKDISSQFQKYEDAILGIEEHVQAMTKEYHELFERIIQNQHEMNALTQDDLSLLKQLIGG